MVVNVVIYVPDLVHAVCVNNNPLHKTNLINTVLNLLHQVLFGKLLH